MPLRAEAFFSHALFALCAPAMAFAAPACEATGLASWYGDELRGSKTANGERFNPDGITAAHRTLPMQSYVEVTALDTGKTILVRINDRGPYHGKRIIDLSKGAARQLGMLGHGARLVRIRCVDPGAAEQSALRRGIAPMRQSSSPTELGQLRRRNAWTPPVSTGIAMPTGQGPYFIRVGTFLSRHRARTLAHQVGAQLREINGLHQVRIGPYNDAKSVMAALAPLAAKGYPDVRIVR